MAAVLQPRNLIPNTEPPAGESFKDLIKQVSAIVNLVTRRRKASQFKEFGKSAEN